MNGLHALLLLTLLYIGGCDDGIYRKRLPSPYLLEYFEEGGLFLVVKSGSDSQGGVFEGIVNKIGWTEQFIVAEVKKNYRDGSDGIYILNIKSARITGPFAEIEVAKESAGISEINFTDVLNVWKE